jgi:hypothetical protein
MRAAPALKSLWMGWVVSALAAIPMVFAAVMKFAGNPEMLQAWDHLALPRSIITGVAGLDLICVALYVFPRTSLFGGILSTGYLGGAISSHLRVGDSIAFPLVLGILIWLGLFIREPKLRSLLLIKQRG